MSAKAKPSIPVSKLLQSIQTRVKTAKDKNTPTDPDNQGSASPTADPANPEASLNMLPNKDNKGSQGAAEPVETTRTGDALPEGAQPGRTGTPEIADPAHGVKHAGLRELTQTMSVIRTKLAAVKPTEAAAAKQDAPASSATTKNAGATAPAAAETDDGLRKLAAALVTTDRGRQAAEAILMEQLGAQAASDLVKQAADLAQQEALQEQAAVAEFCKYAAAVEQHQEMVKQAMAELPTTDQDMVIKVASDLQQDMAALELPEDLQLFKMGAADAAAMMGEADPNAALGGMPDDEMLAAMEQQAGAPSGEPSPEELLAMLEQLVASGQIPPEVAEQMAAALQQDAQGQVKEAAVKGVFESSDLTDLVGTETIALIRDIPSGE